MKEKRIEFKILKNKNLLRLLCNAALYKSRIEPILIEHRISFDTTYEDNDWLGMTLTDNQLDYSQLNEYVAKCSIAISNNSKQHLDFVIYLLNELQDRCNRLLDSYNLDNNNANEEED